MYKIFGPNLNEQMSLNAIRHLLGCVSQLSPPSSSTNKKKEKKSADVHYKCGAANVDLCPKYTHANGGQECGLPWLIVGISGGLCTIYTTRVWKLGRSSCPDCSVVPCTVGTQQRMGGGDWEEEPIHKQHSSLPVTLTNSDRQLTHSFKQGPRVWIGAVAGHHTSCRQSLRVTGSFFFFFFYIN